MLKYTVKDKFEAAFLLISFFFIGALLASAL